MDGVAAGITDTVKRPNQEILGKNMAKNKLGPEGKARRDCEPKESD